MYIFNFKTILQPAVKVTHEAQTISAVAPPVESRSCLSVLLLNVCSEILCASILATSRASGARSVHPQAPSFAVTECFCSLSDFRGSSVDDNAEH